MKIVGNTVGMGLPKPDLRQTDPRKGDFVYGKDEIENAVTDALAQAKASGEFKGDPGTPGKNGTSVYIMEIAESEAGNGPNIVEFSDGNTLTVRNGRPGNNGTSATHSWNGTVLTVTSASGTSSADLKGAKGDKGDKGDSIKGDTGAAGADGVSPAVAVSKSGKVTTISITDKNGTKTATINDGADGSAGSAGKDGTSVTHSWNGTTLTVTSASGTTSANLKGDKGDKGDTGATGAAGKTPVKGTDYFTEADKLEIAEQAASMVEIPDSAGYVVQDTAPADTSVLWVDMSDDSNDGFQEAVNMALAQAKASGEFDGADGKDGQDGYTPVKGVDYFDGANGTNGKTPVKGTDYFTTADKAEIVNAVIAALPVYAGEVV